MSRNLKFGQWTDINILTNCVQNIVHKSAMGSLMGSVCKAMHDRSI